MGRPRVMKEDLLMEQVWRGRKKGLQTRAMLLYGHFYVVKGVCCLHRCRGDPGGGRILKVPCSRGQSRSWTSPTGGWMHGARPCSGGSQLATEHLPLAHSPVRGRSLPDLRAPCVPEWRLVGSPQLCQESLIVVSQGAVRLHVGDRPLLCLPSEPGHQERHSLSLTGEAGGLEDHEPVHLHQEPCQLAGVSREGLGQGGWRRGHGSGPIGGNC